MPARRTVLVAGAVVLTVAAAGAAAIGFGGSAAAPPAASLSVDTAPVTRQTLVDSGTVDGQLDHGSTTTLQVPGGGTVTWLPAAGGTVRRGRAVVRIDERPVPLLYGPLPLYRALAPGVEGADVKQFEGNLKALGHTGFTVDEEYTSSTASAVRDWQDDLGLTETGTVQPGQVVYAAGAIRIDGLTAQVGGQAGGALLTYTGTAKVVTVQAPADDMAWATRGAKVTVTLPDSSTVAGAIATIGTTATASESSNQADSGEPTVPVTITIADQRALRSYDRAPVEIRYSAGSRADVLTVPVTALLALAEGGYGVEIISGGASRTVSVETGLFADGRVEVRGPDLAEGVLVGVPR